MHQPTDGERITASRLSPGILPNASNNRINQPGPRYPKEHKWQWLDRTLAENPNLSPYACHYLQVAVRWARPVQDLTGNEYAYAQTVLREHDLLHSGVFVDWHTHEQYAEAMHYGEANVRKRILPELLAAGIGFLSETNAGGTGGTKKNPRARRSRPNLWILDMRAQQAERSAAAPAVAQVEPQSAELEPQSAELEPQSASLEPQSHLIHIHSDKYSLNTKPGREDFVQGELELIFAAVLEECDDKNPTYAQKAAQQLSAQGVQPEQLAGFNAWWHGTGRTFAVSPNVIVNHCRAFFAAKAAGTGSTVSLAGSTAEAAWQKILAVLQNKARRESLTYHEELAATRVHWQTMREASEFQLRGLRSRFLDEYRAIAGQSFEHDRPEPGKVHETLLAAWEREYPEQPSRSNLPAPLRQALSKNQQVKEPVNL